MDTYLKMLTAGTKLGSYEIVSLLGSGGMGEVYEAVDIRLRRPVAVKVLRNTASTSPIARERFEREARAIAALNHPNICIIHDVGHHDEVEYLVLEKLEGETLLERLKLGPLPHLEVAGIGISLAGALDAAHRKGIIHRDIKPGNIFLTPHGPKFLDFGLAKFAQPDRDTLATTVDEPLTSTGTAVGTVAYMSPEQLRGEPLDPRTDLFSTGLVLYEAVVGRRAFGGQTAAAVGAAILHDHPPAPSVLRPDIPSSLDRTIVRAIQKDREQRHQAAADLLADLQRSLQPSASGVVARRVNSRQLALIVAAIATILVVATGYTVWRLDGSGGRGATVSLQNAELIPLTTSGTAFRASVSPDGKYVTYVERREDDRHSLWIRQTTAPSGAELMAGEPGIQLYSPVFTPDGNYVNVLRRIRRLNDDRRDMWRIPLLGGPAAVFIENTWSGLGWSPDGKRTAFVRVDRQRGMTSVITTDAEGRQERVIAERAGPAFFASISRVNYPGVPPAWSPDGQLIAVFGATNTGSHVAVLDATTGREVALLAGAANGLAWFDDRTLLTNRGSNRAPMQLWTLKYPSGDSSRITNALEGYEGISVSLDRSILLTTRRENEVSLWLTDRYGRKAMEIRRSEPSHFQSAGDTSIAWAGDSIVYTSTTSTGTALYSIPTSGGGGAVELAKGAWNPAVSRDGHSLVFVQRSPEAGGALVKTTADGRNAMVIVSTLANEPHITRDGKAVLFSSSRDGLTTIWSVPIEGGTPQRITDILVGVYSIAESPDGEWLAFSTPAADAWKIVLCRMPSCTERKTLPHPGTPSGRLRWMPDGSALTYVEQSGKNVWVQPLNGNKPYPLTQFPDERAVGDYAWSTDGTRLALARVGTRSDVVMFRGIGR